MTETYAPSTEMYATGANGLVLAINEDGNTRVVSPKYRAQPKRAPSSAKAVVRKKKKKQHKIYKKKGQSR